MRSTRNAVSADLNELLEAIEWVSARADFGNIAYIRRDDGRTLWVGDGIEHVDAIPESIEDDPLYVPVPNKHALGLGKPLALRFAEEYLAADLGEVRAIFGRPGAYQRFKDLLERRNRLADWYTFESASTKRAVAKWAREYGFDIRSPEHEAGDA